jgi:DNA repair exonuclease SbcCD ATPase subunit
MNIGNKLKSKSSNWLEIRRTLNKCSENDLLGLNAELYSLLKSNKDFLEARFLQDNQALERYKAQIKKYLAPNEPWKDSQQISIKNAKKVLSDYKKATSNKIGLIDLMVYYIECDTDFLCEFGDMYEQYYISLESVFDSIA